MMKNILVISLMLFSVNAFAQHQSGIDVVNYQFNISLTDASDTIDCRAIINLKVLNGTGKIDLDLVSINGTGKGMKVNSVWDEQTNQPLSYSHSNDVLHINNNDNTTRNKIIGISYKGIPADGLIISKNKYNQRTFFSDNWPNRARNWLACHDQPSDKASVDFIITAPVRYQVVSNGGLTEETNLNDLFKLTHWHESVDLPTKVMGIGVAEFAVNYAGNVGNVPVYSWVYPADRENGFGDYAVATQILPFFINNIAAYPYTKLANVQSKTIFGGMENAGAIFYSENSVTGNHKTEKIMAHEIAHQWFGNMITESDWAHLWLSEGFATYFSELYLESKYGRDTLLKELIAKRMKVIDFSKKMQRPVVDSTVTDYMKLLNVNSYDKGAWVLHMLHKQLGDSVFWKGIRVYYNKYSGKNAATEDFRKVMEEVSGMDLEQFFRQWLYTAGQPMLHIEHNYYNKMLTVSITQQQQDLFRFPLTIVIRGTGKDADFTKAFRIDKKITSFSLPMENAPADILIDPFTSLLFEEK